MVQPGKQNHVVEVNRTLTGSVESSLPFPSLPFPYVYNKETFAQKASKEMSDRINDTSREGHLKEVHLRVFETSLLRALDNLSVGETKNRFCGKRTLRKRNPCSQCKNQNTMWWVVRKVAGLTQERG